MTLEEVMQIEDTHERNRAYRALPREERMRDLDPEVTARSKAQVEVAARYEAVGVAAYEQMLDVFQQPAVTQFLNGMRRALASEHLRCAALGVPTPSFEHVFSNAGRFPALDLEFLEPAKQKIRQEALT